MVSKLLTTFFSVPTRNGWQFDRTRATSLIVGVASAVFTAYSTYTKNHLANRTVNFLIGVIPTLISLKIYLLAGRKLMDDEKDLTGWERVNAWRNPPSSPKSSAAVAAAVAPPESSAAAAAAVALPESSAAATRAAAALPKPAAAAAAVALPKPAAAAAAVAPVDDERLAHLWGLLQQRTQTQCKSDDFVPICKKRSDIVWPELYENTHHPKANAIQVGGKYLHANRVGCSDIKPSFIVSEAPLPTTHAQFWRAFYDNSITGIIDLTTDNDLRQDKTSIYYPDKEGPTFEYGNLWVTLCEIEGEQHHYSVKDRTTGVEKIITRLHCKKWIDFKATTLSTLKTLVDWLEQHSKEHSNGTVWIHCSAGMGRSCTLITAYILKQKIAGGHITKDNLDDCVVGTGVEVRRQRGPRAIMYDEQLGCVIQFAEDALSSI